MDHFTGEKVVPLIPRGNINNFYGAIASGPDTIFSISGGEPATLRTAEGVVIEIEPGTFTWPSGEPVEGTLNLQWTNIPRILHQVQHRLSMHYGTALLVPEFVCLVYAQSEGVSLLFKKPLLLKWPTDIHMNDLELWHQVQQRQYENDWMAVDPHSISFINWMDPVLGTNVEGYLFPVSESGYWCGGSIEHPEEGAFLELSTVIFPDYKLDNTAVYFLQSEKNRIISLRDKGSGVFQFGAIPEGARGRLFCVTEAVRKNFFTAWQDVELVNSFVWNPRPEQKDIQSIYQMLRAL